MQADAQGEESFVDSLSQLATSHSNLTRKGDFQAWHKPRKHIVRTEQWGAETVRLIARLGLVPGGRPLSYISLPGPDLLDVRVIQSACQSEGVNLLFTGFMSDSEGEAELRISLMEMHGRTGVERQSHVFPDPLQSIALDASVGSQNFENFAPFDVVNLDLCNSVAGAPPLDQQAGCYDAIHRLIQIQKSRRAPAEPWLFFLTTRADRSCVNQGAAARLFNALLTNCNNHEEVETAAAQSLDLDVPTIERIANQEETSESVFEKAFAAAVSKWLLALMNDGNPVGTISLLPSSVTYGVKKPASTDMISLGFICSSVVTSAPDRALLATAASPLAPSATEAQAAASIFAVLGAMPNLDIILSGPQKYNEAVDQAVPLMVEARFDEAKYREWASLRPEAPKKRRVEEMSRQGSRRYSGPPFTAFSDALKKALEEKK